MERAVRVGLTAPAGGVERLGNADEARLGLLERLDQLGEVEQRAAEPIHLVDNDNVDALGGDVGEHALQRRTFERAARDAAIVIAFG